MITMAELLDQLTADGRLDPDAAERIAAALAGRRQDTTPWFIHLLVGFGGLVAALMLIVALVLFEVINDAGGAATAGLILSGLAVGLRFAVARVRALDQAPLAVCLAGEILFFGGVWFLDGGFLSNGDMNLSNALLAVIALELVLLLIYQDRLHRFLSATLVCVALCGLLMLHELYLPAALLVAALGWAASLGWQHEGLLARREELARPAALGLVAGLFTTIWMLLLDEAPYDWPASLGLAAALAYQLWRLPVFSASMARRSALVAVAALLALAWSSPGLLAAPLILIVGFSRGSRVLTGLAGIFLAAFIIYFYSSLEATLLVKSFSLMGVGALLLGARALLVRAATRAGLLGGRI